MEQPTATGHYSAAVEPLIVWATAASGAAFVVSSAFMLAVPGAWPLWFRDARLGWSIVAIVVAGGLAMRNRAPRAAFTAVLIALAGSFAKGYGTVSTAANLRTVRQMYALGALRCESGQSVPDGAIYAALGLPYDESGRFSFACGETNDRGYHHETSACWYSGGLDGYSWCWGAGGLERHYD